MKPVLERVLEAITPRSQSSSTLNGHDQLTTFLLDSYYSDSLQNVQNGSCNVIHESLVWVWLNWWLFKWYKMAIDILQETLTITKVSTNNMVGSPCLSYFSTHSNRIPDWKKSTEEGFTLVHSLRVHSPPWWMRWFSLCQWEFSVYLLIIWADQEAERMRAEAGLVYNP